MTEVTPHPLKTQGFHHFLILLFYDHPAEFHRGFLMGNRICEGNTIKRPSCARLSAESEEKARPAHKKALRLFHRLRAFSELYQCVRITIFS